MTEGREGVGYAHSSEDVKDSITLTERRGITLTLSLKEGENGRLSCD